MQPRLLSRVLRRELVVFPEEATRSRGAFLGLLNSEDFP